MSELINTRGHGAMARRQLLATVSSLALAAYISSADIANAESAGRPVVWIELGSQFESVTGKNDLFVPPFDSRAAGFDIPSLASIENRLGKSYGGEGSIALQPAGSDWVFSAAVRYGRTHSRRQVHSQKLIYGTPIGATPGGGPKKRVLGTVATGTPSISGYADQSVDNTETHTIVDFQVGRDVGLGLFGHNTNSIVSFGARYVRLNTTTELHAHMLPDLKNREQLTNPALHKYLFYRTYHNSASVMQRESDLHALGPSISLVNTTRLLGNVEDGQLGLDWGANAALLFGRQRANARHHSSTAVHSGNNHIEIVSNGATSTRSHRVTVPDLGGFAGLSYRFSNAKLAAGYRADFFFGALDRGLDERHSVTTGFHGPYATFSLGLGG